MRCRSLRWKEFHNQKVRNRRVQERTGVSDKGGKRKVNVHGFRPPFGIGDLWPMSPELFNMGNKLFADPGKHEGVLAKLMQDDRNLSLVESLRETWRPQQAFAAWSSQVFGGSVDPLDACPEFDLGKHLMKVAPHVQQCVRDVPGVCYTEDKDIMEHITACRDWSVRWSRQMTKEDRSGIWMIFQKENLLVPFYKGTTLLKSGEELLLFFAVEWMGMEEDPMLSNLDDRTMVYDVPGGVDGLQGSQRFKIATKVSPRLGKPMPAWHTMWRLGKILAEVAPPFSEWKQYVCGIQFYVYSHGSR